MWGEGGGVVWAGRHPAHVTFKDKYLHLTSGTGLTASLVTALTKQVVVFCN